MLAIDSINAGTITGASSLSAGTISTLGGGLIKGAGTLTASGLVNLGGIDFEGDTHIKLTAQAIQSSAIGLGEQTGSSPTLTIAAGASMTLEGAADIYGADGNLTNAGTLTKAGGAADIVMQGTLTNEGLLTIQSGTLSSTGSAVLAGTITGAGVLDLAGATTLKSGLSLSVGEVLISEPGNATVALAGNVTYAGLFAQHGGTLALAGHALSLTGGLVLDGGTLTGSGFLRESLAATIANYAIGGQATLSLLKGGDQTGAVTIQAASQLESGSSFFGTITGFSAGDFIEITGLQSGIVGAVWNAADTQVTLSDSSGDNFTLNFASAVNTASVITGIGPHGYIGIYHS